MEFKDKIKVLREELGLTLDELAKRVGVSAPTIQRYESGEIKNVRRDKIANLAKALNTTPSYLMGWESESISPIKIATRKIKVYGSIPAGIPVESIEDILGEYEFPSNFLLLLGLCIGRLMIGSCWEIRIIKRPIHKPKSKRRLNEPRLPKRRHPSNQTTTHL